MINTTNSNDVLKHYNDMYDDLNSLSSDTSLLEGLSDGPGRRKKKKRRRRRCQGGSCSPGKGRKWRKNRFRN